MVADIAHSIKYTGEVLDHKFNARTCECNGRGAATVFKLWRFEEEGPKTSWHLFMKYTKQKRMSVQYFYLSHSSA